MANLAKSTAQFQTQFRKIARFVSTWRLADEMRKRLSFNRAQIIEKGDVDADLSSWNLVYEKVVPETNINESGRLFIKLLDDDPGAGEVTVELYRDSGKSSLVATGNATKGQTISFVSAVNPAVTGSVITDATITGTNTGITLDVFFDAPIHAQDEFVDTRLASDTSREFLGSLDDGAASAAAIAADIVSSFEFYAATELKDFLQSSETEIILHEEDVDGNGNITLKTRGILADLDDAMQDNTSSQSIQNSVVSLGAASFDADNSGTGTMTTSTGTNALLDGNITLRCVSQTIGSEEFDVRLRRSDTNETILAGNNLRIASTFRSSRLGLTLLLDRNITDSGTGSTAFSAWAFTGETSGNTNDGVVYHNVTISGGSIILQGYSSSARTSGSQATSGTVATGTGSVTLTFSAVKGSGLSGSVTVNRSTVAASTSLDVNLNVFKLDDKIYLTSSNDFSGLFNEFFAKVYNFSPNSSGSPTISDDMVKLSGTTIYDSA